MAFDESAFAARIDALGLKHFGYKELLARTSSKNKFGTKNSKPPMRLWDNIIPTIIILDELRAELGKSISLQSIYRSEEYNQASSDSSMWRELRLRKTWISASAPASRKALAESYSLFVPGKAGMRTFGFAVGLADLRDDVPLNEAASERCGVFANVESSLVG